MDQNEQRNKTIAKLKELFQLDQPDLDFGFYRIMHVKAKEISEFIEHDLLDTIQMAFDFTAIDAARTQLENAKKDVVDNLGETALDNNGILKSEHNNLPVGKRYLEAFEKYASAKDNLSGSGNVYTHLYRFFSRYYDSGDFISMRYHARETSSVAKPYAIPYGGEEVKLYWANSDQYYIKTAENFRDFTFDPAAAPEIQSLNDDQRNLILGNVPLGQYKVHFTIVDAEEGEHGNVKAVDDSKRDFFLTDNPVIYDEDNNELLVKFEYRTQSDDDNITEERVKTLKERFDYESKKTDNTKPDSLKKLYNSVAVILDALENNNGIPEQYKTLLNVLAPTKSAKKRPLLAKYLHKYIAGNKSDYFIHKNLRAFLRRELDFYIKNEIMNLDDIESADAPIVENILTLIKVFRKIAIKLIDFLGQLEDFQKKLWLKKKFVVECNYCITLDRIRKAILQDSENPSAEAIQRWNDIQSVIFENPLQIEEWKRLGFDVSSIESQSVNPDKMDKETMQSHQPTLNDLPADSNQNDYLMVDTKFFSPEFKKLLLSLIPNFDSQCDGLLIHSENFQALNLLQERYREQIKCIYIDPPYNIGNDGFIYKDNYQHSSWLSMMEDRLKLARSLMNNDASFFSSIDDNEQDNLKKICDLVFGAINNAATFLWTKTSTPPALSYKCRRTVEYVLTYEKNISNSKYYGSPLDGCDAPLLNYGNPSKTLLFPKNSIHFSFITDGTISAGKKDSIEVLDEIIIANGINTNPVHLTGNFKWEQETLNNEIGMGTYFIIKSEKCAIRFQRKNFDTSYKTPNNYLNIELNKYSGVGTNETAVKELNDIGLEKSFDHPKPNSLIITIVKMISQNDANAFILDFFAGSGTTANAVINLNREEGGSRKYILVEMGAYFDTVLKPRIEKIVYSRDWKDGKPTSLNKGVSHCFKYIRLESYEDTLNNLELPESDPIASSMQPALREDFMLHYLLETESKECLFNLDIFNNPFNGYRLNIKRPGSEASDPTPIDLVETFNYLIGLRVTQYYQPLCYSAKFKRAEDTDIPLKEGEEDNRRLVLDGNPEPNNNGNWRFECIEGVVPTNPLNPNNGQMKRVLVIWRKQTGNMEQDNAVLDWFADSINLNKKEPKYDIVYVNGCNNLGADRNETDSYEVRLIEEDFFKKMWN